MVYHEGGQTVEDVAQGGCEISILGSVQNSTGHNHRQPDLITSVLSRC